MEVNLDDIRKTGSEHYPELADLFTKISNIVCDAQIGDKKSGGSPDIVSTVNDTVSFIISALRESANHLEDCGDVLLKMAEEYDFVDGGNAYNIERPSSGFEVQT